MCCEYDKQIIPCDFSVQREGILITEENREKSEKLKDDVVNFIWTHCVDWITRRPSVRMYNDDASSEKWVL